VTSTISLAYMQGHR